MPATISPLRYPGGKAAVAGMIREYMRANNCLDGTYIEPFAGGAGVAVDLLVGHHVRHVVINDLDYGIFCFWWSVFNRTKELTERIRTSPVDVSEWRRQRDVYRAPWRRPRVDVGFSTLYLNRTNHSGIIINGGPIGGVTQQGPYKIDARYNADDLCARIERLARFRRRVTVTREDGLNLLMRLNRGKSFREPLFAYLDPPYVVKGPVLYLDRMKGAGHVALATWLKRIKRLKWMMTYDVNDTVRELYSWCKVKELTMHYSARKRQTLRELLILPPQVEEDQITR